MQMNRALQIVKLLKESGMDRKVILHLAQDLVSPFGVNTREEAQELADKCLTILEESCSA